MATHQRCTKHVKIALGQSIFCTEEGVHYSAVTDCDTFRTVAILGAWCDDNLRNDRQQGVKLRKSVSKATLWRFKQPVEDLRMRIGAAFFLLLWVSFSQAATEVIVVDADNNPLAGVVVYATSPDTLLSPTDAAKTTDIHQYNKAFAPFITVVAQYQTVRFINDDRITHHVYSAMGPERFSFKHRKDAPSISMTLNNLGDVPMGCNIHDWMSGHILVLPTPYFGMTDAQGRVSLVGVPDGDVNITVWHPQLVITGATHQQSWTISLPTAAPTRLQAAGTLGVIPKQEAPDDVDFLGSY